MFIGLFCGILVGVFISLIWIMIYSIADIYGGEKLVVGIAAILIISSAIGGGVIGGSIDKYSLKQDIDGFVAIKATYESAMVDTNISSLERLQIVNIAIEQNKCLARRKATIDAWWYFCIGEDLEQELKSLEPIGITR